jgi:hypothetical protein
MYEEEFVAEHPPPQKKKLFLAPAKFGTGHPLNTSRVSWFRSVCSAITYITTLLIKSSILADKTWTADKKELTCTQDKRIPGTNQRHECANTPVCQMCDEKRKIKVQRCCNYVGTFGIATDCRARDEKFVKVFG